MQQVVPAEAAGDVPLPSPATGGCLRLAGARAGAGPGNAPADVPK